MNPDIVTHIATMQAQIAVIQSQISAMQADIVWITRMLWAVIVLNGTTSLITNFILLAAKRAK